jgi:cell division protease FtsH
MRFFYIILFSLSNVCIFNNSFVLLKTNTVLLKTNTVLSKLKLFNNLLDIDSKLDLLIQELNELKKEKYKILLNKNKNKNKIKVENYEQVLNMVDEKINMSLKEFNELKKEKNQLFGNQKGLKLFNNTHNETDDSDDTPTESPNFYPVIPPQPSKGRSSPSFPIPSELENRRVPVINIQNNIINKNKNEDSDSRFEIIQNSSYSFKDIGGYDNIKEELLQVADILVNYTKYSKFNIRTPKGLILEGPPGNGKTLMAKCLCGEINVNFIAVSGSEFIEKYVGVGSARISELFKLATDNIPCVVFIDEIDALGRKRSDSDNGNTEHASTLNQLLVKLDGFHNMSGVFVIGATNRKDLLDSALMRPGRMDKIIYMGLPDSETRESIINIHIKGKPYEKTITVEDLVHKTNGLSGAQIENLLNEAMLGALRNNQEIISSELIEDNLIKVHVGYQSSPHKFSKETIKKIAIHEVGHAIVGLLSKNYNKLVKVSINLWSPKSPGLTQFDPVSDDILSDKNKLITQLAVSLGGRIAEEIFYGESITTGAVSDLDMVKNLAYEMVYKLGMGETLIHIGTSDKSKELIDLEVTKLINIAYAQAKDIIIQSKKLIEELADILAEENILLPEIIQKKIKLKYLHLLYVN